MSKSLHNKLVDSNRIVSFGCSLTYGEELSDATPDGNKFSYKAYPARIADYYECDYTSYAKPGYSNESILRTLHDYITSDYTKKDAVVIGWSGIDRTEFYNKVTGDFMALSPGSLEALNSSANIFNFTRRGGKSYKQLIDAYKVISKYNDNANSLNAFTRHLFYAQSALAFRKIPFIMVNTMDIKTNALNIEFSDYRNLYTFRSFMKMAVCYDKENGKNKMKPNGHPNEEIHHEWANELIEWINHV